MSVARASRPESRPAFAGGEKRGRDTHELGGCAATRAYGGRNEKARARYADGGSIDGGDGDGGGGGGGGVGGILNLGVSIDFTIWTPPKVKNKPSRTYSTLIECLSSARLVSTHRPPSEREKEGDARGMKQCRRRQRRRRCRWRWRWRRKRRKKRKGDEGRKRGRENQRGEETGWKRARERQRKGVIKKRKGGRRAKGAERKESGEMP